MFQSQNKVQRQKTSLKFLTLRSRPRLLRVGIRKHPGLEFVELPNFQVGQVSHYSDVANDFSAFSQQTDGSTLALGQSNVLAGRNSSFYQGTSASLDPLMAAKKVFAQSTPIREAGRCERNRLSNS
jgi:hypothetical protein